MADDEMETTIHEDYFYTRNLHPRVLDNGVAVLGYCLLPILRYDERITTVVIRGTCAQCIELASYPDGSLSDERLRFHELLGFETDDIEDNACVIGRGVASLPHAKILEIEDASDVLENEFFIGMLNEIADSETIDKITFVRCTLNDAIYDALVAIFNCRRIVDVEFRNCNVEDTLVCAIRDCETYTNWCRMCFRSCKMEEEVHTDLIRIQSTEMRSLLFLEYRDCIGVNRNWSDIYRESSMWRHAEYSHSDATDQLALTYRVVVTNGRSGTSEGGITETDT